MVEVIMYTAPWCSQCPGLKKDLEHLVMSKNLQGYFVRFKIIDVSKSTGEITGIHSVPQVYINGRLAGGVLGNPGKKVIEAEIDKAISNWLAKHSQNLGG